MKSEATEPQQDEPEAQKTKSKQQIMAPAHAYVGRASQREQESDE